MIDKLWERWQNCAQYKYTFSADPNTIIPPFGVRVKDTFETVGAKKYCYTYSQSGIDSAIRNGCPA